MELKLLACTLTILFLGCSKPIVESKMTIAVVDTRVIISAPHSYGGTPTDVTYADFQTPITEAVEAAFRSNEHYEVLERQRLGTVQHELALSQDDLWLDQSSIAKIGLFKGAKYLVMTTAKLDVGIFSTSLVVQVKITEVETGRIINTFTAKSSSVSPSINGSVRSCLKSIQSALTHKIKA